MPNEPTAEQVDIRRRGRQRLVGAVVLALLAVVFIPMILDPEPRQERKEPSLAIPAKEAVAPLPVPKPESPPAEATAPKVAAAPDAPPARVEPVPAPSAPEKPEAAKPEPAKAEPAKAEPARSEGPKAPKAAKPESPKPAPERKPAQDAASPKLEGFAVQVGAFREPDKLAQARDKLKAARLSHYTERLASSGGDLTRLRAGPFPTREAAEKAAAEMKRAGLSGQVIPLP